MATLTMKKVEAKKNCEKLKFNDAECDKYNKIWEDGDYKDKEKAALLVFGRTQDDDPAGIYARCCVLDRIYATNVKYMDDLVKHICELKCDKNIIDCKTPEEKKKMVEEIAQIKTKKDNYINYISFASKYCRMISPDKFPIYDSVVKVMIAVGNGTNSTRKYDTYINQIDAFKEKYNLSSKSYVEIDHYLWLKGKEIENEPNENTGNN